MISMAKQLDQHVDMAHVREQLAIHFARIFRLEWTEQSMKSEHSD